MSMMWEKLLAADTAGGLTGLYLFSSGAVGGNDNPSLPSWSDGDFIVVVRTETKSASSDGPGQLTPSGWTKLVDVSDGDVYSQSGIFIRLFARIAVAGMSNTPDFKGTGGSRQTQVTTVYRASAPITAFNAVAGYGGSAVRNSGSLASQTIPATSVGPSVQVVGYSSEDSNFNRLPSGHSNEIGDADDSPLFGWSKDWISDSTRPSISAELTSGAGKAAMAWASFELS